MKSYFSALEKQEIDQYILNYLEGNATADEIESLRGWIKEDKANEIVFKTMSSYWQNTSLEVQYSSLDDAFLKLKAISSVERKIDPRGNLKIEHHRNFKWLRYVAVLLMLISISALLYLLVEPYDQPQVTEVKGNIIKQNPKGQKLTTFLPDGSKVILNSESKIEYQAGFNSTERLILLDGEAFFEVTKDESKPFRVEAGGVSVVALGTSFVVNSKFPDMTEVSLVTGSVKVSGRDDQSVVLSPGKSAVVKEGRNIQIKDFDLDEKVGWKDGLLVFKENSLDEIFDKLKDWYGVEFLLEAPIRQNQHFSGKYRNAPLDEVLEGIAFVHHFEFKIQGDSVRIFKKN